jgi:hypothetical protein
MLIPLDELRLYSQCSLAWFWQIRAGWLPAHRVSDLVGEAMRAALALYYTGQADRLGTAVALVWQGWCEAWGDAAISAELARYARERADILARFESGAIRNFDGELYTAPRLTNKYRTLMHDRGLTTLGRRLDEFARTHGLLLEGGETGRPARERTGSEFGDAFADCLAAAGRMAQNGQWPLPAPEVVLGLDIPFHVELTRQLVVEGAADIVRQAPGAEKEEAVVLEIHSYEPQPFMRASLAGRDLRVIAALLAAPALVEGGTSLLTWTRVEHVIFRHWPSGEAYSVQEANAGHLLSVVTAVARGFAEHVVVPRALNGYDDCRACAFRDLCWSESGWGTLPFIDPHRLHRAENDRAARPARSAAIAA